MSERHRLTSQSKLPTLDITSKVTPDFLKTNIVLHTGDAQFISFRSLNEQNPKFPVPNVSVDQSTLNSSIRNDLCQNKRMIRMLDKTMYKQKNDYQEVQENLIRKMRTVTRMQKQVKRIPHRIDPFRDMLSSGGAMLTSQQQSKKKVTFPMYFNGIFFQKLQHNWIPAVRENTMATEYYKKIYFFGGIGSEVMGDIIEYDILSSKFRELKQNGDLPLNRYGHCLHALGYPMQLSSIFTYDSSTAGPINGKQLIMFGGEMQYNSALKLRENLSDTRIYDIETQTWQLLKPNIENIPESRRSFGSCIVGKGLIIMGGIKSRFNVFNDIHYLNLSQCKWGPLETQKNPFNKGIAFQQLVCTYNKPQYIFEKKDVRSKPYRIQESEGIFCFGGCYIDEQKNTKYYDNFMAILKLDLNNTWIIPETTGKPPKPRIQHSVSYLQDMNIIVIFGGRDDSLKNPYYNDIFAYKIVEKEWTLLEVFGEIPRPRAAHCAIPYKSQILYFGGVSLNGYQELSIQLAELNQNTIRQLQSEFKPLHDLQLEQKEITIQPTTKSFYSLHTTSVPQIQTKPKMTKEQEREEQIRQLSFQNFAKHLK